MTSKYATGLHRINHGRSGHSYRLDGTKPTGVTTAIKQGRVNHALIRWAAKETAQYVAANLDLVNELAATGPETLVAALTSVHQDVVNKAAARGTAVHALAEKLTRGEEIEYPDELAGYVEAHVQFLDQWQVRPVLVEAVVANRTFGIAGTGDLVADVVVPGDITLEMAPWLDEPILAGTKLRACFDTKTSRSGIWPDCAYQVAAYVHAEVYVDADGHEQSMAELGIDQRIGFAIWTRQDGYDVKPLDIRPDTFKTFQYFATIARRIADDSCLVGQAVIPEESYRSPLSPPTRTRTAAATAPSSSTSRSEP